MAEGTVRVSRECLRSLLFRALMVEIDEIVDRDNYFEISVHGIDVPEGTSMLKMVTERAENYYLAPAEKHWLPDTRDLINEALKQVGDA